MKEAHRQRTQKQWGMSGRCYGHSGLSWLLQCTQHRCECYISGLPSESYLCRCRFCRSCLCFLSLLRLLTLEMPELLMTNFECKSDGVQTVEHEAACNGIHVHRLC